MIAGRLRAWFLGELLYRANATRDQSVYAIKDRLLETYGTREPWDDCQHITRPCWGPYYGVQCGLGCTKCGGTGIYSERLVRLEVWRFGARSFHRPWTFGRPLYLYSEPVIEGLITHDEVRFGARHEAKLWLLFLFDRPEWWRSVTGQSSGFCWLPMEFLAFVIFEINIARHNLGWRVRQTVSWFGRPARGSKKAASLPPIDDTAPF